MACILVQPTFKPGDLPPEGYLAWHEWADVQRKAGIKQRPCGKCGTWRTPQEFSEHTITIESSDRRWNLHARTEAICIDCASEAVEGRS